MQVLVRLLVVVIALAIAGLPATSPHGAAAPVIPPALMTNCDGATGADVPAGDEAPCKAISGAADECLLVTCTAMVAGPSDRVTILRSAKNAFELRSEALMRGKNTPPEPRPPRVTRLV